MENRTNKIRNAESVVFRRYKYCKIKKMNNSEFKPKPLEEVLDALYMKLEVESICRMSSSDTLKLLASVIWYLEDLKEIKDKLNESK